MIKNCEKCKKEFVTYPSRIKKSANSGKFCSVSCSLYGQKRHIKPHTNEAKIKIGKNTPKYSGEKHWNWKGGIWKDKKHRIKMHGLAARRHRILKRGNRGSHTMFEWELLKKQYGFQCPSCKREEPEIKLEADHIIPLTKGGSNYIENIQPLCRSCNASKYNKIIKFEY